LPGTRLRAYAEQRRLYLTKADGERVMAAHAQLALLSRDAEPTDGCGRVRTTAFVFKPEDEVLPERPSALARRFQAYRLSAHGYQGDFRSGRSAPTDGYARRRREA